MRRANVIVPAEGGKTDEPSEVEAARIAADAMLRAALECCHQHDRLARLLARPALEAEHDAADKTCLIVSDVLTEVADAYAAAAKSFRPNGPDAAWWHRANALWHASREFSRRQMCGDGASRRLTKHDRATLAELVVQFDLEASALLSLRQAADAYRAVRPDAW